MTIPTRPAPAPPQSRYGGGTNAAADANASLEQLRIQLQQQQQQQQQQKLTIKLPPPPKFGLNNTSTTMSMSSSATTTTTFPLKSNQSHINTNSHNNININNNNNNNFNSDTDFENIGSSSSITRKFPKARYTPTTNWNDAPFDGITSTATSGNINKKVPPPRPPPPKVLVNGHKKSNGGSGVGGNQQSASSNILTNIFNRKKSTVISNKNAAKEHSAARLYGLSSGNYASTAQMNGTSIATATVAATASTYETTDWNAAWNTSTNTYAANSTLSTTTTTTTRTTGIVNNQHDIAQLISFDSPPSSPTFTQKSNSDCVSVDSFSSDSNFSSPQNGSVSQPESGFEDDFSATSQSRSRPATTSPLDPWETFDAFGNAGIISTHGFGLAESAYCSTATIGTAPVRNLNTLNMRQQTTLNQNQDNPLCNGKSLIPPPTASAQLNMPTIIKPKISQKPKAPKPPVFGYHLEPDLPTPPSPPMPQCAPPPPPSILDVISGKVDALQLANHTTGYDVSNGVANETPYGIALYDFEGTEEGDLCFREGEKIYLLEYASEDWYRGKLKSGCEGILPCNYVDVKVPLHAVNVSTAETKATSKANNTAYPKVRCLYNFPAEVDGDLALKENDLVTILYRINEDWLFGEFNNRQGQFPANFLEYIPTNLPLP